MSEITAEILKAARELAFEQIEKFGSPYKELFEIAENKALELAKELSADKNLTHLGVCLMDIQVGRAIAEGKSSEHIAMGMKLADEFLGKFSLDNSIKNKIINCIEAHHGTNEFKSLEAEICANADCYKFLTPKGIFFYLTILGKRESSFSKCLKLAEEKLEEKHNILTLDICKAELEPYYQQFKKLFAEAKAQ